MASLIEIQGGIPRTQDYATLRQQEDMKSTIQQAQSGIRMDEQVRTKSSNVHESENADNYLDGSGEGKGERKSYAGDGGKNRKKKQPDGKVVLKSTSGIDIKI